MKAVDIFKQYSFRTITWLDVIDFVYELEKRHDDLVQKNIILEKRIKKLSN